MLVLNQERIRRVPGGSSPTLAPRVSNWLFIALFAAAC